MVKLWYRLLGPALCILGSVACQTDDGSAVRSVDPPAVSAFCSVQAAQPLEGGQSTVVIERMMMVEGEVCWIDARSLREEYGDRVSLYVQPEAPSDDEASRDDLLEETSSASIWLEPTAATDRAGDGWLDLVINSGNRGFRVGCDASLDRCPLAVDDDLARALGLWLAEATE